MNSYPYLTQAEIDEVQEWVRTGLCTQEQADEGLCNLNTATKSAMESAECRWI